MYMIDCANQITLGVSNLRVINLYIPTFVFALGNNTILLQPVEAENTHSDSATFSATFSRFSSFFWPDRASKKYLAGPIESQLMIPC